jgi:hypothetical protein
MSPAPEYGHMNESATEFVTTAEINAPLEAIWQVLTDAARYADWNPEIIGISGQMALNERIKARVKVGGRAVRWVAVRVTAFEPPSRMEWTGGLPLGLFVGVRTFTLSSRGDTTEFRMHVRMSGPLASFIVKSTGNRQPELDMFAAALKARAERLTAGS